MKRPVTIMFHSVGLDRFNWSYPHISEPIDHFSRKMEVLKRMGYGTEFFVPRADAQASKARRVTLTFDDGYLDNWVHVLPILQEHGFKATVFVTPEFVDPRDVVRPQNHPVSTEPNAHDAASCCAGFLSWAELREMEKTGLVDVQSHGLTHDWYFKGPRVVDFWHPGSSTEPGGSVWMLWNEFRDLKPHYLTRSASLESKIPYGTPVYEHDKALEARRFFPDPSLGETLLRHIREHGGVQFFRNGDWRNRLAAVTDRFQNGGNGLSSGGRFETDSEYRVRIERELSESKCTIEKQLGKRIDALCWPGGGVNDRVLEIARGIGYRYFTLPSAWRSAHARGQYADLVPRIASRDRVRWRGRDLGRPTPREFVWHIESARGSTRHTLLKRAAVSVRLGWSYLTGGVD